MTDPGVAPRGVVLIGMAGSGKTTVGRIVAERLGARFVDTDDEIAGSAGRSVAEIFRTEGEDAFRALELAAFQQACAMPRPHDTTTRVVATGGGFVTTEPGRAAIADRAAAGWTVVWLSCAVGELAERIGDGATRPLLAGSAAEAIPRLLAEREEHYRQCATVVVETSARTVDEVATEVLSTLDGQLARRQGLGPDTMD